MIKFRLVFCCIFLISLSAISKEKNRKVANSGEELITFLSDKTFCEFSGDKTSRTSPHYKVLDLVCDGADSGIKLSALELVFFNKTGVVAQALKMDFDVTPLVIKYRNGKEIEEKVIYLFKRK